MGRSLPGPPSDAGESSATRVECNASRVQCEPSADQKVAEGREGCELAAGFSLRDILPAVDRCTKHARGLAG